MRSRKPFLAAAAVGLGLLTGCASHQVDDHSLQFNEATGSLNMRLLLLNAVRASKDYPLQFSKLATYTGKGVMSSASISASLPLKQTLDGSLSPKFEFNDGISKFDLVDLNTEEAQEALKRPLTHSGFVYHTSLSGNRSSILPQLLLLEQVVLSEKLAKVIDESVKCTCKIVDGQPCASSTINAEPSPPLKETAKKYDEKLRTDAELRALMKKFRNTRLALKPFVNLTKMKLSVLRNAWHAAADDPARDDNDYKAFGNYVKMAEDYLQLGTNLAKLRSSRSEFIKTLQINNSVADEMKHACASLEKIDNECRNEKYSATMDKKIVLKNDLTTECKHKVFIYGLLQAKVIGMTTKEDKPDKPEDGDKPTSRGDKRDSKGKEAKPRPEGGNVFNVYTVDPKEDKAKDKDKRESVRVTVLNPIFAARCLSERPLCSIGPTTPTAINGDEIAPQLRSPERVVRYLGELIAAQNYGEHPFTPSILDPERKGQRFTVLTVLRGRPLPGSAAVSIHDPEGETFYIPRRSHDAAKTDLSLETLSIVTDVLNAAVSKKNFPPVAAITVTGP